MTGTALRSALGFQAAILDSIRGFFAARGVLEVTTPSLAPAAATDPALASIGADVRALGGPHFLQTSPEHAMKRLLAAGSGDIWQLARVYRDGELGRWHQPEFLLLEWYRTGFTDTDLMDETFELLTTLFADHGRALARLDIAYADAFRKAFAVDIHAPAADIDAQIATALRRDGIDVPAAIAGNALLDLALTAVIVPQWPRDTAVFLCDYPESQAALAALKPGSPTVAARFELFVDGLELANGYRELTDAAEQRRRFEADLAIRQAAGLPAVPIDDALLTALEAGLPDCAGIALGVERLLAVLGKAGSLKEVVPLAHDVP